MFTPKYLILAAASAALLAGCTLSTASRSDDPNLYDGRTAYAPAYQPQPQQAYTPQTPIYQQPVQAPLTSNLPNTGQWQWGSTPDGYRTRIWIPDNSWKGNSGGQSAYSPPANQPP